jgi:hypothetical protein
MAAAMGLYLLLCSESLLEPVERPPMVRSQATPVDSFDDGCGVPDRLRRDARTNADCNHPVTHIGPTWSRSAQTYTGDLPAESFTPLQVVDVPEATLGTTNACRPSPVGKSHRRGRRRVMVREAETPSWLGAVVGAILGLLVAVNSVAAWAWASAITGVGLLVADTHFWWPVCAALSLNYWCAAAFIAAAVSWDVGLALVVLAVGMRESVLLFMDPPSPKVIVPRDGELAAALKAAADASSKAICNVEVLERDAAKAEADARDSRQAAAAVKSDILGMCAAYDRDKGMQLDAKGAAAAQKYDASRTALEAATVAASRADVEVGRALNRGGFLYVLRVTARKKSWVRAFWKIGFTQFVGDPGKASGVSTAETTRALLYGHNANVQSPRVINDRLSFDDWPQVNVDLDKAYHFGGRIQTIAESLKKNRKLDVAITLTIVKIIPIVGTAAPKSQVGIETIIRKSLTASRKDGGGMELPDEALHSTMDRPVESPTEWVHVPNGRNSTNFKAHEYMIVAWDQHVIRTLQDEMRVEVLHALSLITALRLVD